MSGYNKNCVAYILVLRLAYGSNGFHFKRCVGWLIEGATIATRKTV